MTIQQIFAIDTSRKALRGPAWALLLLASLVPTTSNAAVSTAERNALTGIYNSALGSQWRNNAGWNGAAGTECGWAGVTCDSGQTTVVGLNLANNNLQGTLSALSSLTNLAYFDASQNALTGPLPSLAGLTKLQVFNAFGNRLSGAVPALTGLSALQQFRVWGNQLTGSLPLLTDPTGLVYFDASNNQLTGSIPAITQLAALEQFIVSSNQLSGSMPSVSGLANLKKLDVSYNQLTGAVSDLSTTSALQTLYIDHNNLSGALPAPPTSLAIATVCPNVQLSHTDNSTWDLVTGQSPWYKNCGAGSQLVITDINGGVSPAVGAKFSVTISVRDGNGSPAVVSNAVYVQLGVVQGTGKLYTVGYYGSPNCYISVGSSSCTVSNVSYSVAESQVRVQATVNYYSGMPALSSGTSSAFTVVPGTYTVGGTVTGLVGPGLVLSLYPWSQAVTVDADGSFTFPTPLGDGADYQVAATTQPSYPPQSCGVNAGGSGTILGSSISSVQVVCRRVYSLIVRSGPNGSASPQTQTVLSGNTAYFSANPSAGYRTTASGQGCSVSASVGSGNFTTSALTSDCIVTVTFVPLDYRPVTPAVRVLDTRASGSTSDGSYARIGPLAASTMLGLPILGRAGPYGGTAIPTTGIGALVLNVLATNTSAEGYMTVWPSCATRPNASNLNFVAQQTIANLVIVPVGCDATTNILSSTGPTDVVIDVVGYFTTGPTLTSLSPSRLLDTRPGTATIDGQAVGTGPVSGGTQLNLQVAGRAGIPANASAVALNVTATNTTAPAFVTVWPTDQARPNASNLNVVANQTIPNMVIAKLSATGQISLFNSAGNTDFVVDAVGWISAGSDLTPLVPARLVDTRRGYNTIDGYNAGQGPVNAGSWMYFNYPGRGGIPQQGAGALVLNITVTNPQAAGYLSINAGYYSSQQVQNVNFVAGQTVPNLVIVPVSYYSSLSIYSSATTDVVVDVVGWMKGP